MGPDALRFVLCQCESNVDSLTLYILGMPQTMLSFIGASRPDGIPYGFADFIFFFYYYFFCLFVCFFSSAAMFCAHLL